MKHFFIGCLFLMLNQTIVAAADDNNQKVSLPYATYNSAYFPGDDQEGIFPDSFAAITGKVLQRMPGPEQRPVLQVQLSDSTQHIWVAVTFNIPDDQLNVDDDIDVLGFFDETKNETQYVAKLTDDRRYLLGVCFNVKSDGRPVYNVKVLHDCLAWEEGKLALNPVNIKQP